MMKMKRIGVLMCACLSLLGTMVSCNDELYMGGVGVLPATKAYYLHTNIEGFNLADTVVEPSVLDIECLNVPWQLNIADHWLKASPAEGNGEKELYTISVGADANPSTYYRMSVFNIESTLDTAIYKYSQPVWVAQQGNTGTELSVSCDLPLRFRASASSESFTVETNAPDFGLRTQGDWITAQAMGNEVSVSVSENTTDEVRIGYVYFDVYAQEWQNSSPTTSTFYVEVRQEAPQYSVSEESLKFQDIASTKVITLFCDLDWSVTTSDSWISVSPSSGSAGTVNLEVSVTDNGNVGSRSGSVFLHLNGGYLVEIPVTQIGLYIDITGSQIDFESGDSSRTVSMSTNLSYWRVLEKPSWVKVSPDNGEDGAYSLALSVEDNPNTTKREGYVIVGNSGLSLTDSIKVTQAGKWFDALETVLYFENVASSNKLEISTDGDWNVTTSYDWISVTPTSGHGSGQVTVHVRANDADDQRTGLLAVSVGGTVQYVNVVQKGRYFSIDQGTSVSLPSRGGTMELDIATNQAWTAEVKNHASWLALSETQGEGNAHLIISAHDHPSLESRTDTIVFTPTNKQGVKLAVTQAGRYLKTDAQTVSFFYRGGEATPVTVLTDGSFRVEQSAGSEWLTVAVNNNLLTLNAEPYDGNDKRVAVVSVYLTGLSGETSEVKMVDIAVAQYSKYTQFIRDEYGEDLRLDVSYKDGGVIIRSDFGSDEDLSSPPSDSGEIGKGDYGSDEDLSSPPSGSGEIKREDYEPDMNME